MMNQIATALASIDQNTLTAVLLVVTYLLARKVLHLRAWNVHNIKTNRHCNWRGDRKSIGYCFNGIGEVQLQNRIEDFCLMVLRVRYRNETRVKLVDETGETVFATRVWVPKSRLTPGERFAKKISVTKLTGADGKCYGITAGKRFMVPAKNILEGVYQMRGKYWRYNSNTIPEMIVLPASDASEAAAKAAVRDRRREDRRFVERHYRRAAWSWRLAYGRCVRLVWFLPIVRYDALEHEVVPRKFGGKAAGRALA